MPTYTLKDENFMKLAIEQAKIAAELQEIPVGAIVVKDGEIVGKGYNRRETDKSTIAHAEILAIEDACKNLNSCRLNDCELYVTLEPCPMCAGAIINARIKRVIYGASDEKWGCCGSLANFLVMPFEHNPMSKSKVLEKECEELLLNFFKNLRKR